MNSGQRVKLKAELNVATTIATNAIGAGGWDAAGIGGESAVGPFIDHLKAARELAIEGNAPRVAFWIGVAVGVSDPTTARFACFDAIDALDEM